MESFFFSSRRRHTRCSRDWSSDVCSSDLVEAPEVLTEHRGRVEAGIGGHEHDLHLLGQSRLEPAQRNRDVGHRSEERRVGKECRARWALSQSKKKGSCTFAAWNYAERSSS